MSSLLRVGTVTALGVVGSDLDRIGGQAMNDSDWRFTAGDIAYGALLGLGVCFLFGLLAILAWVWA